MIDNPHNLPVDPGTPRADWDGAFTDEQVARLVAAGAVVDGRGFGF